MSSSLDAFRTALQARRTSRIRIENFGPIKTGSTAPGGWLDIRKCTVLIGRQGSGKSTVAKLISTFTWMEKALIRGDYDAKRFSRKGNFKNQFLAYHRLEQYLTAATVIEYEGEAYRFKFHAGLLEVTGLLGAEKYPLPQVMYAPAERNFLAYVKTTKELRLSSPSLQEFLTEYTNAKAALGDRPVPLPINDSFVEYDRLNDRLNLRGPKAAPYKLNLADASSGFQSLVPLYLVTDYLARSVERHRPDAHQPMSSREAQLFAEKSAAIVTNPDLTAEQQRIALSGLSARINKTAFVNIVEEPEQNLFPDSQRQLLHSLLTAHNRTPDNRLVLTTHSPYLLTYLTLAVKAHAVQAKVGTNADLLARLYAVVPATATAHPDEVAIYELDERAGTIQELTPHKGLPSDENTLNEKLSEANSLFTELLKIEQQANRLTQAPQ